MWELKYFMAKCFSYKRKGIHTWLDMYQEDVTLKGMKDGVRRSDVFLLILVSNAQNFVIPWNCF